MKKNIYNIILAAAVLSLFLIVSCKSKSSITPSKACENPSSSIHPKGTKFQSIIQTYVDKGLPGIALLVQDDDSTWFGAAGKADLAADIDMQACHISKVASLTKIFMASLAFKLAEEDQLDLDNKVTDYLDPSTIKGVANADLVSVRQLLNHTSGIYDVIQDKSFYLSVLNDPPAHRNQEDLLKFVRGKPAAFAPGTATGYSNTNTLLLSLLIEKATGKPHQELLRSMILNPYGFTHSYYFYHEALPNYAVAQGYYDLFNNQTIVNVSSYNTGSGNGYTGLYSNVFDLYNFIHKLFVEKTIINESSLSQMLTFNPHMETGSDRALGQGVMKDFITRADEDEYAYGHRGRDLGYSADMFYFPEKKQTYVLIVNYGTDGESFLRPAFYELRTKIVDAMMED